MYHLPPQGLDQFLQLIQDALDLVLVVVRIDVHRDRAHAIAVAARLAQRVLHGVVDVCQAHLAGLPGGSGGAFVSLRQIKGEVKFGAAQAHAHIRRGAGRHGVHGIHDHVRDAALNGVDEGLEAAVEAAELIAEAVRVHEVAVLGPVVRTNFRGNIKTLSGVNWHLTPIPCWDRAKQPATPVETPHASREVQPRPC